MRIRILGILGGIALLLSAGSVAETGQSFRELRLLVH